MSVDSSEEKADKDGGGGSSRERQRLKPKSLEYIDIVNKCDATDAPSPATFPYRARTRSYSTSSEVSVPETSPAVSPSRGSIGSRLDTSGGKNSTSTATEKSTSTSKRGRGANLRGGGANLRAGGASYRGGGANLEMLPEESSAGVRSSSLASPETAVSCRRATKSSASPLRELQPSIDPRLGTVPSRGSTIFAGASFIIRGGRA